MRVENILTTIALTTLVVLTGCSDSSSSNNSGAVVSGSPTVTLANLNILHGFDCDPPAPADGDQCRVKERVALLRDHLIAQGCPDVVTLQEVINAEFAPTAQGPPVASIISLIEAELPNLAAVCRFTYQMVYKPLLTVALSEIDEEVILSRYPVLQIGTRNLYGTLYNQTTGNGVFARHALYARIDHPSGEIDVYTTHLASGSDFGTSECVSGSCPMECISGSTVRECQAEQLALYVEQTRGTDNLALITGDFNAVPYSSEHLSMTSRNWLDSHIVADQPECDGTSGIGCTGGRDSSAESLENPALQVDRRIDYIFAVLPPEAGTCIASTGGDRGTYKVTDAGLFAAEPNPFSETCGSPPNAMCWVSDHSGNQVRLACES